METPHNRRRLWSASRGSGTAGLDGGYEPALTLPSGGDTSYAGMVWHEGQLWVSYYASHEGKTAIDLARVKVR